MHDYNAASQAPEILCQQRRQVRTSPMFPPAVRDVVGKRILCDNDLLCLNFVFTSTTLINVWDDSPLEPARSRRRVVATGHLRSIANSAQQTCDLGHSAQRAHNLGNHDADQANMNGAERKTRRSHALDYALAKQLCSLQTKPHNVCK